jgi:hypothetical protein
MKFHISNSKPNNITVISTTSQLQRNSTIFNNSTNIISVPVAQPSSPTVPKTANAPIKVIIKPRSNDEQKLLIQSLSPPAPPAPPPPPTTTTRPLLNYNVNIPVVSTPLLLPIYPQMGALFSSSQLPTSTAITSSSSSSRPHQQSLTSSSSSQQTVPFVTSTPAWPATNQLLNHEEMNNSGASSQYSQQMTSSESFDEVREHNRRLIDGLFDKTNKILDNKMNNFIQKMGILENFQFLI